MRLPALLLLLALGSCENRYSHADQSDRGYAEDDGRDASLFDCDCGDILYCPSCWLEESLEAEAKGRTLPPIPDDLKGFLRRHPEVR